MTSSVDSWLPPESVTTTVTVAPGVAVPESVRSLDRITSPSVGSPRPTVRQGPPSVGHVKPDSMAHDASHPSPADVSPSSHASPVSMRSLPQIAGEMTTVVLV